MAIPTGVILIWTGTNASIPSGWERETTLDDKFPKAWGAQNPNTTGGSNTHTHSAGSHTHTQASHTHNGTLDVCSDTARGQSNASGAIASAHSHNASTSSALSGGNLNSTPVTWSSVNQEPSYYKVIFVKPSGTTAPIKAGLVSHYNGATVPTGYYYCNGSNGTIDLRNKYLKGAGSGADAGAGSGATSHQHSVTHSQTASAHSHTGTSASDNNEHGRRNINGSWLYEQSLYGHTHTITWANTTATVNNYTKADAGSGDTVEPAYKKMGLIECSTTSLKLGMVGLWLGTAANCPTNWQVCDGTNSTLDMRDKFIKIPTDLSTNNATGGANTHTHSTIAHTHTATGTHTHTASNGSSSPTTNKGIGTGSDGVALTGHAHNISSISTATATYANANITCNTVDNQPAYRTAAYIELMKVGYGGSFLLNFV